MSLPVAILAGGLATRMRPLTERIPKALIEVAGQPFAAHQLELLKRHGFDRVVFCVGYLGEMVQEALGDGGRWGMQVSYVSDGDKLLGTGGALRKALPLLGEAFLVLYGDAYLDCDYRGIETAFLKSGKLGLMTVFRNANTWGQSNVFFQNRQIIRYDKHHPTPEMQHIDYGVEALKAEVFEKYLPGTVLDLSTVLKDLVRRGELAAVEVTQRFYEVGSPDGLRETHDYLKSRNSSGLSGHTLSLSENCSGPVS